MAVALDLSEVLMIARFSVHKDHVQAIRDQGNGGEGGWGMGWGGGQGGTRYL